MEKIKNKNQFHSTIIVVNWNGLVFLNPLVAALKKQNNLNFSLIVLDNGSQDGSKDFLFKKSEDEKLPFPIWVLNGEENYGFALANNIAISFAFDFLETDAIILLNNDTLPDKDFIKVFHNKAEKYFNSNLEITDKKDRFPFLSQNKEWSVGSLSPLIENYFAKGQVDSAGILISADGNAINRGVAEKASLFKAEEEVFGPTAASVMYRIKALKDVALPPQKIAFVRKVKNANPHLWQFCVDRETEKEESLPLPIKEIFASRYFAYFEDVDLAIRMRLRFWSSVFIPSAKISHHHSATGKSYSPFKSFHIHRNQYFNLIRDFPLEKLGRGFKLAFKRYFLLLRSVKEGRGPASELVAKNGSFQTVGLVIKGWFSCLFNLYGLIQERIIIQSRNLLSGEEFDAILKRFKASREKMIFETPDFLKERKKSDAKDKDQTWTKLPGGE